MVAELLAPDSLPPTPGDDQVGGQAPPHQSYGAGALLCRPCMKVPSDETTESANALGTGNYVLPPCAHAWCACPVDPTSTHNLCTRCETPLCHHCCRTGVQTTLHPHRSACTIGACVTPASTAGTDCARNATGSRLTQTSATTAGTGASCNPQQSQMHRSTAPLPNSPPDYEIHSPHPQLHCGQRLSAPARYGLYPRSSNHGGPPWHALAPPPPTPTPPCTTTTPVPTHSNHPTDASHCPTPEH